MLTERGYGVVIACLLVLLLAFFVFHPPFMLLALFLASTVLLHLLRFRRTVSRLSPSVFEVRRIADPQRLLAGRSVRVAVTLTYHGRSPLLIRLHDHYLEAFTPKASPPDTWQVLRAGSKLVHEYELTAHRRGRYLVGPLDVVVIDSLLLSWRRLTIGTTAVVTVYPSYPRITTAILRSLAAESRGAPSLRMAHEELQFDEFRQIRDYVTGDNPKHIAWRAVARAPDAHLLVREFEGEAPLDVVCLLDATPDMALGSPTRTVLDEAVEAIAALAHLAVEHGDQIGALSWGGTPNLTLPAARGPGHLLRLLEQLVQVEAGESPKPLEVGVRQFVQHARRRALLVILSRLSRESSSAMRRAVQLAAARGHEVLIVGVEGTSFVSPGGQPGQRAAHGVLQEIEEARLRSLRGALPGVGFVVAGATHVTVRTATAYLYARQRGVLAR